MLLLNLQSSISPSDSNNIVIIATTENSDAIVIEDLQAIVNLSSVGATDFTSQSSKILQLSLRDVPTNRITNLLRIPLYNKRSPYSENLLSYLTSNNQFLLAKNKQLRLNMITAGSLSGSDLIAIIGQANIPDTTSNGSVVQNFVTANYAVPSRDNWVPVSFESNWRSWADQPLKFYKDQIGRVHLQGWVEKINNSVSQYTIFKFPAGYRFDGYAEFTCYQAAVGSVQINVSGDSVLTGAGSTNAICLTGISFLAA